MKKIELFSYTTLFYFLIRGCFLGISCNNLMFTSRSSCYFSVLFGLIIGFIPLFIFYKVIDEYPDKNIYEILEFKFGSLGKFMSYLLAIFVFLFACIIFWNLINFISSQFLHRTPNVAIGLVILLAINHALLKGINVISRVSVILFFINVFFYSTCFFGLTVQIKPIMFLPLFNESLFNITTGTLSFIGFNILPIFILSVIPKNMINDNKFMIKNSIIIYIVSTLTLFFVVFLLMGIYGIEFTQLLQYTEYHLLKRFSIMGTIDRTENIFATQWLIDIYMFLVLSLYFVGEKIKIKNNFKYSFLCFIMLIVSTMYFSSSTVIYNFLLHIFPYFIYLFLLGIPLLIVYKKEY